MHDEEPDHGTHEHHPLDAEVEDPGALGQQLAESGVQERCAVRDGRGEDDDDDAAVHATGSAGTCTVRAGRATVIRYWTSNSPPSIENRIIPCMTPTSPDGKSALWSV